VGVALKAILHAIDLDEGVRVARQVGRDWAIPTEWREERCVERHRLDVARRAVARAARAALGRHVGLERRAHGDGGCDVVAFLPPAGGQTEPLEVVVRHDGLPSERQVEEREKSLGARPPKHVPCGGVGVIDALLFGT
jgi:hypothetical protein